MSKNIKLNDTDYNGISTVQLPTTDGGTATFKDTDEITVPSETQTVAGQTSLGQYGGLEFDCITSGKATYIITSNNEPTSTNRNPFEIWVYINLDKAYVGNASVGYTGAFSTATTVSAENGKCTILGSSAVWLKDGSSFIVTRVM